ncbi:glycosyl hydrolase lipoprotein [Bacillaceae bacterium SAS-127]|nr:glycosyl hydrolase lipoprotein [Bacillaceae bacterium SAS-127]
MKWVCLLLASLVLMTLLGCQNVDVQPAKKEESYTTNELATEQFIRSHLLTKEGLIQTDVQKRANVFLSESLGLWMLYLVDSGREEEFAQQVTLLQDHFLDPSSLVYWEINEGKPSKVNAWIDDARIMRALYKAAHIFDHPEYIEMAKDIGESLNDYAFTQKWPVDYVDIPSKAKSNVLTISYLDSEALDILQKLHIRSSKDSNSLRKWVQSIPVQNGFYPKSFNMKSKAFHYDEEINLIDQLYVAYHLEQANISTDHFAKWINQEFQKEKKLVGRYHFETKIRSVTYESPAVYSLAVLYSVEREEKEQVLQYYQAMKNLSVQNKEHSEYGGYIDISQQQTHSFDNLLPLLAERTLLNERYIR